MSEGLKPFWRYYGGKWRAAPRYPAPRYGTIVEPFAGAAGYSLRYPDRRVILVEKYPVIAAIWRYLIAAREREILAIPCVDAVADLPAWVQQPARDLVGWSMNCTTTSPRSTLSRGLRAMRDRGRRFNGWTPDLRARVASQVERIKHWTILEGGYEDLDASDLAQIGPATWFVDPPYQRAGIYYSCSSAQIDFAHLGAWCRTLPGQAIVCEAEGADWLPFRPLPGGPVKSFGAGGKKRTSAEAIWTSDDP